MTLERLETLARTQLPDLEGFVITGGDQEPGVRAPGHIRYPQLVARDGLLKLAIVCSPHLRNCLLLLSNHTLYVHVTFNSLSALLLASHSPLGENLTLDTALVWPARVNLRR